MTCANPRFPRCKHPKAAHIPGGCDQCVIVETCDQYMEGDMSDETVEVKVKLPKPDEGKKWEVLGVPELTPDGTFAAVDMVMVDVHIAPPERTVMVELLESDAGYWVGREAGPYAEHHVRLKEAARKALAAQQEVCGEIPEHDTSCYRNRTVGMYGGGPADCDCSRFSRRCRHPKGHAGIHCGTFSHSAARKALAQEEVCGEGICRTLRGSAKGIWTGPHDPANCNDPSDVCRQPKAHVGEHNPEVVHISQRT